MVRAECSHPTSYEAKLKKKEIETVFEAGKKFHTSYFVIRWLASNETSIRVGFAFSRHRGSAVERNRFKRRFRNLLHEQGNCIALHLVITPKTNLGQINNDQWQQDKDHFKRFLEKHKTP